MSDKNAPIIQERDGSFGVSVFEQFSEKAKKDYLSIVLQKSWKKDENSEWKNDSINFFESDISKIIGLLTIIRERLTEYKQTKK